MHQEFCNLGEGLAPPAEVPAEKTMVASAPPAEATAVASAPPGAAAATAGAPCFSPSARRPVGPR